MTFCLSTAALFCGCAARDPSVSSQLVQVGGMHETIGQRQFQPRVDVADVVGKPHFYGVGAAEGLKGEITVLDSVAVVTRVAPDGTPQPVATAGTKATLLVGQSVDSWTQHPLADAVSHERFDETIGAMAIGAGIGPAEPFVFVVDGAFTDVRLHVINGACPIHARMKKQEIAEGEQPFELNVNNVSGTLVGIYAADSVGRLTHPGTATHTHLIYTDPATGHRVTGHVERVGLARGVSVKLPARANAAR